MALLQSGRHPCVLVLSHGDTPFDPATPTAAARLLGAPVTDHPRTRVVRVPAVPSGRLRASLRRVVSLARAAAGPGARLSGRWGDSGAAVEQAVASAHGDLRHGVASVELALGGGVGVGVGGRAAAAEAAGGPWHGSEGRGGVPGPGGVRRPQSSRDESVDSLRAVGRLLHATREAGGALRHDLPSVAAETALDGPTLLAFVSDGYPRRVRPDADGEGMPAAAARRVPPGQGWGLCGLGRAGGDDGAVAAARIASTLSEGDLLLAAEQRAGVGPRGMGARRSGTAVSAGVAVVSLALAAHNRWTAAPGAFAATRRPRLLDARRQAAEVDAAAVRRCLALGLDVDAPLPALVAASRPRDAVMRASALASRLASRGMELPSCVVWACSRAQAALDRIPMAAVMLRDLAAMGQLGRRAGAIAGQGVAEEEEGVDEADEAPDASLDDSAWLELAGATEGVGGAAGAAKNVGTEEEKEDDDEAAWLALEAAEAGEQGAVDGGGSEAGDGGPGDEDAEAWLRLAAREEAEAEAGWATGGRHPLACMSRRAQALVLAVGGSYGVAEGAVGSAGAALPAAAAGVWAAAPCLDDRVARAGRALGLGDVRIDEAGPEPTEEEARCVAVPAASRVTMPTRGAGGGGGLFAGLALLSGTPVDVIPVDVMPVVAAGTGAAPATEEEGIEW